MRWLVELNVIEIHDTGVKIVDAQQAKIYMYENSKLKLLKANVAIWFNKICKTKQLTPKYINIKINGNNNQTRKNRLAAIKYRINQEIKFLYCKKQ